MKSVLIDFVQGVHEVTLETGSSLALTANNTLPNSATMVSLGFRSTQSSGVLLHTRDMVSAQSSLTILCLWMNTLLG